MPPNRTSRPRSIPENLIVNWRSSSPRDAAKPLLRRPVTACDACRAAKAKCSGKQGCDRCTTRGIACTYTSQVASNRGPATEDSVHPPSVQATWPMQGITQGVPAGSPTSGDSPSSTECQPSAGQQHTIPADWTTGLQHQNVIHPVNCDPIDIAMDVSVLDIVLLCASVS